jgi:hypothetical protein
LQSVFALERVSEAQRLMAKVGNGTIWEVEADAVFRADMELLSLLDGMAALSFRAHHYWSGTTFMPQPLWELLLAPPVRVLRQVTQ